jgi:hypothetical protein
VVLIRCSTWGVSIIAVGARQSQLSRTGFGFGELTAKSAKNAKRKSEYFPQRRKGAKIWQKLIPNLCELCAFAGEKSESDLSGFPIANYFDT